VQERASSTLPEKVSQDWDTFFGHLSFRAPSPRPPSFVPMPTGDRLARPCRSPFRPRARASTVGNYLVHSPRWGLGFQKMARERGAVCYLRFPGHPSEKFDNMWDFLLRKVEAASPSKPPESLPVVQGHRLGRFAPTDRTIRHETKTQAPVSRPRPRWSKPGSSPQ
jgi:hypothetical protein